jgi:hypothetical protein
LKLWPPTTKSPIVNAYSFRSCVKSCRSRSSHFLTLLFKESDWLHASDKRRQIAKRRAQTELSGKCYLGPRRASKAAFNHKVTSTFQLLNKSRTRLKTHLVSDCSIGAVLFLQRRDLGFNHSTNRIPLQKRDCFSHCLQVRGARAISPYQVCALLDIGELLEAN